MSFLDTIDVTSYDDSYDRLVVKIQDAVATTQTHQHNQPLPSIILMTKKQQKMLRRYPQMKAMHGTTQKYWLTKYNVMEVVIKQPAKELA